MQVQLLKNDSIAQGLGLSNGATMKNFLRLPNICLFLIGFLLLISLIIYVKKIRLLKIASDVDINFMNRISDYIHDGKIEAARSLCKSSGTPAGRIIDKGIGRIGTPVSDVYSALACLAKIEGYLVGKGIQVLLSLSAIIIVLGFMGSLFAINSMPSMTMSSVAGGNTGFLSDLEAGLIAGLSVYLAYRRLISKQACFGFSMQQIICNFMDLLNEPAK